MWGLLSRLGLAEGSTLYSRRTKNRQYSPTWGLLPTLSLLPDDIFPRPGVEQWAMSMPC